MKMRALIPFLLVVLCAVSHAQTPAAGMLPTAPAGVSYRYWQSQLVQWIGPELPYSMIVLEVDARGPKPVYDVMLMDRSGQKTVHYTNQPVQLAIDKAAGSEAYLVAMQYDAPAEPAKEAQYLLRFVTEKGVPVSWQFVQGSDMSEQGSGLNVAGTDMPVLLYREQGAVAAEGTALKIGNVTSAAQMWKEISQPPYFIAYHGAVSQDVHQLAFVPRAIEWKVEPSTAAVAPAAEWKLTSAEGQVLNTHVETFANGVATLQEMEPWRGTTMTVEAAQTAGGWAWQRVRYAPTGVKGEHSVSLTFTSAAGDAPQKFDLIAGKKKHLASGTVTVSAAGSESWVFTQPEDARKPPVVATSTQVR